MIVTEFYRTRSDGVDLNRTYSDQGMYILQNETGIEYAEAIDVVPMRYSYTDTNHRIEEIDLPYDDLKSQNSEMKEALNIMGVKIE